MISMTQRFDEGPTMDGPATYRIYVKGHLVSDWSDRLADMKIESSVAPNGQETTTLEGRLADQAALFGVLNTLYELHLPVLSVECLDRVDAAK
jgi:hypothetical protein